MRPHEPNTKSFKEKPKNLWTAKHFEMQIGNFEFVFDKKIRISFLKAGARSTIASVLDYCLWIVWHRHSSREVGRWVLWCVGASVWLGIFQVSRTLSGGHGEVGETKFFAANFGFSFGWNRLGKIKSIIYKHHLKRQKFGAKPPGLVVLVLNAEVTSGPAPTTSRHLACN